MKVAVYTTVDIDTQQWAEKHDTTGKSASDVRRELESYLRIVTLEALTEFLMAHGQPDATIRQTHNIDNLLSKR